MFNLYKFYDKLLLVIHMNEEIKRFDDLGRGICYIDGKVTFVPFSVPGDILDICLTYEKKNYNEALIKNIIKPSKDRISPKCPYFGICGGCRYQMVSYENEIRAKLLNVINYFKKNNLIINPLVIKNEHRFNYRNKITLKVKDSSLGFYKDNTHDFVKIDYCYLASEKINEVIKYLKEINIINGEVIIRTNYKDEVLIIINTQDYIDISILKEIPNLKGIVINDKTVYKDNYFKEDVNGLIYNVTYDAFFQVNRETCGKMFKLVENFVSKDDYLLDLYSGVGTLGLSASLKAKEVLGIEINKNAVDNANSNALINNLGNAEFIYSDANNIKNINFKFNKLIVDPPRSGLSKSTIDFINTKLPDEIMYISCDYHTQVRDLKLLDNYEIINSYICDMFSNTYHVETICILKKREVLENE